MKQLELIKYLCFQTGNKYGKEAEDDVTNKIKALLVVVTTPELSWTNEIENITRFVHCTVVPGKDITWDRVQNSIRDEEIDILHFICHSDDQGIDLNGELIEPSRILGLCKNSNCKLVFFSSCESIRLGQHLVEEGVPSTISYVNKINDKRALAIATDFYQALHRGLTAKQAYHSVNPNTAELIWLSNGRYAETEANELIKRAEIVGLTILRWLRIMVFLGLGWFAMFLYFWLSLGF